ncbi:hypothetical protein JL720_6809 [Aureococcus anophagefferens]|nr:hypothetical protein JL720_6809 [Aureococcus anophagefferens]
MTRWREQTARARDAATMHNGANALIDALYVKRAVRRSFRHWVECVLLEQISDAFGGVEIVTSAHHEQVVKVMSSEQDMARQRDREALEGECENIRKALATVSAAAEEKRALEAKKALDRGNERLDKQLATTRRQIDGKITERITEALAQVEANAAGHAEREARKARTSVAAKLQAADDRAMAAAHDVEALVHGCEAQVDAVDAKVLEVNDYVAYVERSLRTVYEDLRKHNLWETMRRRDADDAGQVFVRAALGLTVQAATRRDNDENLAFMAEVRGRDSLARLMGQSAKQMSRAQTLVSEAKRNLAVEQQIRGVYEDAAPSSPDRDDPTASRRRVAIDSPPPGVPGAEATESPDVLAAGWAPAAEGFASPSPQAPRVVVTSTAPTPQPQAPAPSRGAPVRIARRRGMMEGLETGRVKGSVWDTVETNHKMVIARLDDLRDTTDMLRRTQTYGAAEVDNNSTNDQSSYSRNSGPQYYDDAVRTYDHRVGDNTAAFLEQRALHDAEQARRASSKQARAQAKLDAGALDPANAPAYQRGFRATKRLPGKAQRPQSAPRSGRALP